MTFKLKNYKITRLKNYYMIIIIFQFLNLFIFKCAAFPQANNTITNDGTTSDSWYIGTDTLAKMGIGLEPSAPVDKAITVYNTGEAGSQTFVSGWQAGTGWLLSHDDTTGYTLELDNLNIRGTLSASELLFNQIRATNGNLIVTSAAKVETGRYIDFINHEFIVEDVTGHGIAPFVPGDMIMCQIVNMAGAAFDTNGDVINNAFLIKRLIYKVESVDGLTVHYTALPGAPVNKGFPQKGDTFVRIGNVNLNDYGERSGTVGLFADEAKAPYIRITDSVDSWADWHSIEATKVQLGNLTGISDPAFGGQLHGYGLYSNNAYIKGKVIVTNPEDLELEMEWDELENKPDYFNAPNGQGLFISSTNMGYYNTDNYPLDPWRTYMDNQGRFYLKGNSTDYFSWNGSNLVMRGNGNFLDISTNISVLTLDETIENYATQISQNAYEISLKANKEDLNELEIITTAYNTAITQNATAISFKANQSDFNDLEEIVSTHSTEILQNANEISLKVSQDDFNGEEILSLINLDATGVRIAGNKIRLDGNVQVLGSFKVKGSAIIDTINADVINVVNLNAANITHGFIDTSRIPNGTIAKEKIYVDSVTAINKFLGTVQGGTLNNVTINAGTEAIKVGGSPAASQGWVQSQGYSNVSLSGETETYYNDSFWQTLRDEGGYIKTRTITINGVNYTIVTSIETL